jgi:hypothetical protein
MQQLVTSPPISNLKKEKLQAFLNSGKLEKIKSNHRTSESMAIENTQTSMNIRPAEAKNIDSNQIKSNFQTISAMRVSGIKEYQNIDVKHRGLIKPCLGPPSFRDLYE